MLGVRVRARLLMRRACTLLCGRAWRGGGELDVGEVYEGHTNMLTPSAPTRPASSGRYSQLYAPRGESQGGARPCRRSLEGLLYELPGGL